MILKSIHNFVIKVKSAIQESNSREIQRLIYNHQRLGSGKESELAHQIESNRRSEYSK